MNHFKPISLGRIHTDLEWVLAVAADERVVDVSFDQDTLNVRLKDGCTIMVPLAWYPRLFHARAKHRRNWKISGGGYGIYWPLRARASLTPAKRLRSSPAGPIDLHRVTRKIGARWGPRLHAKVCGRVGRRRHK